MSPEEEERELARLLREREDACKPPLQELKKILVRAQFIADVWVGKI